MAPRDPIDEISARSPVTSRSLVIALLGVALLIIGALAWSVFGRAPDTVTGQGVILPAQGYAEIGTRVEGTIEEVLVSPGDRVTIGEPVASVLAANDEAVLVRSTATGQVVEVGARPGRLTAVGEPLVIVEPAYGGRIVKGLLPAGTAETVKPGMQALVSPASAPRAQYGFIIGEVTAVAPAPATRNRLLVLLGDNDSVVDYLLSNGPVQEVTIALATADTASGYQWSIGSGPQEQVTASTLALVSVITSDSSVISWVFR